MKPTHFYLLLLTCLQLTACGWQLRGTGAGQYPAQLQLVSPDRYAPLVVSMARAMQTRHIASTETAPLRLELDPEKLGKRTVAVTSIGSAAQYELTLSASWRLYRQGNNKAELVREGTAPSVRVFDFQTGNNPAKTEEENALMAEMRRELANNILKQTQEIGSP